MKKVIYLFCIFHITSFYSQIFYNQEGQAFSDVPFFNASFIKETGIHELKGKIYTKRPNDIIRETKGSLQYKFDEMGRLILIQWFKPYLNQKDTISTIFIYDENGTCVEIIKKGEVGILSTQYKYEAGILTEKKQSVVGMDSERIQLYLERYSIQKTDTIQSVFCKNQYNLVFSEITKTWNSKGYLLNKKTNGVMSNESIEEKYQYNLMGLLSSLSVYTNGGTEAIRENCYSYDGLGNLIERVDIKNGYAINEIQVVYNQKNMLPSSIIYFDRSTEFMEIIRFY